jgi:hypothetical protein
MWWNAVAGFAQGVIGSKAFRAQVRANNMLSEVNANAKNKIRTAQNAEIASRNNLARWMQSVNNNRTLDSGGDALEANVVNYRRQQDSALSQDFSSSIRSAEQEGASAAAAALNGVDGNVVDMVNGSVALRDSIVSEQVKQFRGMQAYDTARRAGSIMSQMVGGLDQSIIMDTLDYNTDIATHEHEFSALQYGLLGMIQHMGGVSTDPSPKKDDRTKDLDKEREDALNYADQHEARGNGFQAAPQSQSGKFGFQYDTGQDNTNSPYSLWSTDKVTLGRDDEDRNDFWSR